MSAIEKAVQALTDADTKADGPYGSPLTFDERVAIIKRVVAEEMPAKEYSGGITTGSDGFDMSCDFEIGYNTYRSELLGEK